MIIYRNTKGGFIDDIRNGVIGRKVLDAFVFNGIHHNNPAEYRSWENSLRCMRDAIDDSYIDDDCRVAIEYKLPLAGKRIDFLIEGLDETDNRNIVVVELKQWEQSEYTGSSEIVKTYVAGGLRPEAHPSYQAYTYTKVLENFYEAVSTENIHLIPCAFLHNYKESLRKNIDATHYSEVVKLAPVFLGVDTPKLRDFIKSFVRKRSGVDLLMKIENGRLRPSKSLQDTLASMLRGNQEFYLIDEQKVAYEAVKKTLHKVLKDDSKATVIIQGGPGTGKSVIAIQLLCDLTQKNYSTFYVTKNAAPREVYFAKLQQDNRSKKYISSLFKSSSSFTYAKPNSVDCILADEAHRLMKSSGRFFAGSGPQARDIINAARVSVFFIDEQQRVTGADACTVETIRQYAKELGSTLIEGSDYNLTSQFRCNGSDSYLALINSILGMQSTPNSILDLDYDIRIFDSPTKMREELRKKNLINNKSRMLAGYCYEWKSQDDPNEMDICLKDGFRAQWNFGPEKTKTWAIDEDSFDQVGCIHTSQGLEFDYVGVIIGKDLVYLEEKVQTDASKRAGTDYSLSGTKGDAQKVDAIIRNTYKTLLSRGQKGCYIYCEDKALADYIREQIQKMRQPVEQVVTPLTPAKEHSPILQDADEEEKYISFYPVYTIRAACGAFGDREPVSQLGWMKVTGHPHKDRNKFIIQAVGHSMEPRIHDGDYCLFEAYQGGSREGKIVLAEHHGEVDEDYEGAYSIKTYRSKKTYNEFGEWEHESIDLWPLNPAYRTIHIDAEDSDSYRIIGEFIETIDIEK